MSGPAREHVLAAPSLTVQRCTACAARAPGTPCRACGGSLLPERDARRIQAKLRVNPAGDVFEREADRIADTVLDAAPVADSVGASAPAVQTAPALQISTLVQRQTDDDDDLDSALDDEDEAVQMERAPGGPVAMGPAQEARVSSLRGGGAPLSEAQRSFFEPRFGHDFSAVRIHNGAQASDSARELGARAYTVGHDVVFGAGEFQPSSRAGMRLLAHELTHVVQQNGGTQGASRMVQRDVLQRDVRPCPEVPAAPERGAVRRVRIMQGDGLVTVELTDDTHFSMALDSTRTRIQPGSYTAVHQKGNTDDCILGNDYHWHVNKVPRAGGWSAIASSSYELIVSDSSPAFEPDPADIGRKAKPGKDVKGDEGKGVGKDTGTGTGSGKGAGAPGGVKDKDKTPGEGGKGSGDKQPGSPDEGQKIIGDFQKQLGDAGADATVPPDLEIAAALKELTEGERADLARYLRDAKAKADEEGKGLNVKDVIEFYKKLSPSDRELLRTNLELARSKSGPTELPKHIQIAIETGTEKTAQTLNKNVNEFNTQIGELARLHAKVNNPRYKEKDFEPIDLNKVPIFTEMMMLEGLLAGASSKSPEIETISKELMGSINGIRDYVLEEIAWLIGELVATNIIAALLAPVTLGISEVAEGAEAAYVIKRLNDLREFLQKVEKIYNAYQKIRALINKVIGVYDTYKRLKAQYDKWGARLEKLYSLLEKAGDAGDDIEDQIEKLEDELIDELQKSLDDPQGLGSLLEQFFIPVDTDVDELKQILFNIPKGIEAFRELISYYGSVDRTNMEDVKTLAYKGVRAGVLLYPFVGYLAMLVGNELKTLMQQPDLSDRLLGILTNAYDKASKRKLPTSQDNRKKLKEVKKNKDKPKKEKKKKKEAQAEEGADKAEKKKKKKDAKDKKEQEEKDDPKRKKPADKPEAGEDPKAAKKKKKDDEEQEDDPKASKKKQDAKDKKDEEAKKKDGEAAKPEEDPKKKKEREQKEQSDSEWAQVVAKVAQLHTPYATKGANKDEVLKAARVISKAHKTVAGGPKIHDMPGKGYWKVSIARKGGGPTSPATNEILMGERTRLAKGRRAVEAKVAALPDTSLNKASIAAAVQPLEAAYAFKDLHVGDRKDSRQGLAVFGSMPGGSEQALVTIDDMSNLHTGTASDPIPIRWYKHPGNYESNIKLRVAGNNFQDFPMNSSHLLKTPSGIEVFVGIDTRYMVKESDLGSRVLERKSTPRSGTKQKQYHEALKEAGFNWAGRDADHVLDLGFAGSDDFDNLWPLEIKRNRWAFTERWYREYYVEYRDPANPREAQVKTLFTLRGFHFKVMKFDQNVPKEVGGRSDPKKGTP